jgi:carbon monoxide dehydrogenase subunit G
MSNLSYFESRSGKPDCTPEQVFNFFTDLRNFERFIPAGTVAGWNAEMDSCSFRVPQMGDVSLNIAQKEEYNFVAYKGSALKINDFELVVHIRRQSNDLADVKVALNAGLNPMMKMLASKPIGQFLGMLIDKIESFNCWEDIREKTQHP